MMAVNGPSVRAEGDEPPAERLVALGPVTLEEHKGRVVCIYNFSTW
jgi:hypothetical protein